MPQLDKLTFYSQAITFFFSFVLLFVTLISIVLPVIFRAQRVRFLIKKKKNLVTSIFLDRVFINIFKSFDLIYFHMIDEFIHSFIVFEKELKNSFFDDENLVIINNINTLFVNFNYELSNSNVLFSND